MKPKISFISFIFWLMLFFSVSVEVSAQTKQRLIFKNRVAKAHGTIKGEEIRQFVFWVRKNQDVDISIDTDYHSLNPKPHPKFLIYKPNGKPLFEDQEPASDVLEVLDTAGDYTIRLQLPEEMRNGGKPVKFLLQVILK